MIATAIVSKEESPAFAGTRRVNLAFLLILFLVVSGVLAGCSRQKDEAAVEPNEKHSQSVPADRPKATASRESRLETAVSLHAEGLRRSANGDSKEALACFGEAYRVRRELLGLHNTNTYATLEQLAFGQSARKNPDTVLRWLNELEQAATNLFRGQELTNRLMALYQRQHSVHEELGNEAEAEAAQKRTLRLAGVPESVINQSIEATKAAIKVATQKAEATRIEMEKWASQMQSSLFPQLAAAMSSNLAAITKPDTNSAQYKQEAKKYRERGYSEDEVQMSLDQTKAMHSLVDALAAQLQGRGRTNSGPSSVPNSQADLLNDFRKALGGVVEQHPNLLSSMKRTNDSRSSSETLETWFDREWEKWNEEFEDGTPLNRLVGDKQYSDPLLMIPGDAEESGQAMALLALNLKGLLLDREFRFQAALAQSSDPSVSAWREKLWQLQIESLRSRPQPIDPAEQRYAPREVLRNSPFTLLANEKLEEAQREFRVLGLALPGAGRREIVSTEIVSARLPAGSALIEFMRYGRDLGGLNLIEQRFGAVVIAKAAKPVWVDLGSATNISALVNQYVNIMRRSESAPPAPREVTRLLETLCDAVWKPVEGVLPADCKTVFLAPDSDLHLVSFATLRKAGRFLCESRDFVYVTSGRALLESSLPAVEKKHVEIWADAEFDARPQASSERKASRTTMAVPVHRAFGVKFGPLTGTGKEALSIKEIAEKQRNTSVQLHLKASASEAELRKVAHPFVLHLGTHGFFLPLRNGAPDRPWETGGLRNQFNGDAALYQSGIALAGANKTINAWGTTELPAPDDDGILVAAEAAQLDLRGTWLVTLSACDTGMGGVANGEALLGAKLGFLQAGAQNVCFSLWRVNDAYAPGFMRAFYEKALKSGNASTALTEIQRTELASLSSSAERDAVWKAAKLAGPFVVTARGQ